MENKDISDENISFSSSNSDELEEENNSVFSTETYPEDDLNPNKLKLSLLHLKPKTQGSSFFGKLKKTKILLTPALKFYDVKGNHEALIEKIKICKIMFDFNDPLEDIKEKEIKRTTLSHVLEFIKNATYNYLSEEVYSELVLMFKTNIFRDFPYTTNNDSAIEDEEIFYETSWPHLSVVYEILKELLSSKYFTHQDGEKWFTEYFVSNILELFNSRDRREQNILRLILHTIYTKIFKIRPFIRQYMASIFLRHVHEEIFYGISSLLELYSCIINGFSVPVKDEHLLFLDRALLPLHTGKCLNLYFEMLQLCIITFIKKSEDITPRVVKYLFVRLPKIPTQFRILIISEVEKIFNCVNSKTQEKCLDETCFFLSKLINDQNYLVSERALNFAKYTYISTKHLHSDRMSKRISDSVITASKEHWNKNVNKKASDLLKCLSSK